MRSNSRAPAMDRIGRRIRFGTSRRTHRRRLVFTRPISRGSTGICGLPRWEAGASIRLWGTRKSGCSTTVKTSWLCLPQILFPPRRLNRSVPCYGSTGSRRSQKNGQPECGGDGNCWDCMRQCCSENRMEASKWWNGRQQQRGIEKLRNWEIVKLRIWKICDDCSGRYFANFQLHNYSISQLLNRTQFPNYPISQILNLRGRRYRRCPEHA